MSDRTRKTIFGSVIAVLLIALIVWWYSGFSLDFMKFFAAEPESLPPLRGCTAPPGCTCQVIECIKAPCDPLISCPMASCSPRPACLDETVPCATTEPTGGWCPPTNENLVSCLPIIQTVKVNTGVTVIAQGGVGTYRWSAPEGSPAAAATVLNFRTGYATPGVKRVLIYGPRRIGGLPSSAIDVVGCTVVVTE